MLIIKISVTVELIVLFLGFDGEPIYLWHSAPV